MAQYLEGRVNSKWFRMAGDHINFDTLIIMSSQGKGATRRVNPIPIPPKTAIVSISGGGIRDAIKFMDAGFVNQATTVIIDIGTNDICAKGPQILIAPLVTDVLPSTSRAPAPLAFGDRPGVVRQRQKMSYGELLAGLKDFYAILGPGKTLITVDPVPRITTGFCTNQIAMLGSRIEPFGPRHHHIRCLKFFVAHNKRGKKGFGGTRVVKATLFDKLDPIHVTDPVLSVLIDSFINAKAIISEGRAGKNVSVSPQKGIHFQF